MPSKISIHVSGYTSKTFDVLGKMQPSVVKVFNQSSEMNIDRIRQVAGRATIVYRHYSDLDYRNSSADAFFAEMRDTFNKLRGRDILWEGINEPVVSSVEDARALNRWFVRFAEIMHSMGEKVAGFSWSTGNPTPEQWDMVLSNVVEAAAAVDAHAFHEYHKTNVSVQGDLGRYRLFEKALPPEARKPVVITEAGIDNDGDPITGGWLGKVSTQQYLEILKQYDAILLQDPYVLGATVYQWGDGRWPSFELNLMTDVLADYSASVGGGPLIPKPWPVPIFGPVFTANPTTIQPGGSSTLSWSVDDATAVYLDGEMVAPRDTLVVSPTETKIYTLRIVYPDETTQELTVTVTVRLSATLSITNVKFEPTTLVAGGLLNVSITVHNGTNETFQTQGPNPGFVYEEGDTFRTRGFTEVSGAVRVGIDFEERTGIDHPYRWGLGTPLAPGETRTITGAIRLKTARSVKYWVGLVREQIVWLEDQKGTQLVTVNASGALRLVDVKFTPVTLVAGNLLNVNITVRNDTAETFQTQEPAPGFVYEEGDDFRTRGFTEVAGAVRVGIDFDGRAGIDHPYRWGLGSPIAPGETKTIAGAIRLKTARSVNYWAGLVRELVVWAEDRKGVQAINVTPAPSGVLEISNVQFTPTTLRAGELLNVSITVRNGTGETLQTQGPPPGLVYEEGEDFRSRGFGEARDALRVGVDFDGRSGIDHPYRWGLGTPLAPGETRTITGAIRLKTARTVNYWAGLVREQVVWLQTRKGIQSVAVTPAGAPMITAVSFSPGSLPANDLLTVSITVKNESAEMLQTQGPEPGTVYEEGDTFRSRGFNEIRNAFRVGVDFDGRAGVDHPYRWGLGAPLAPGQSVTIEGAIRLKTVRSVNYWAGLVREQIAWLQDGLGKKNIVVTQPTMPAEPTFTVTPTSITAGQSATLTWRAPGAQSVSLDWQAVNAEGTQIVSPTQNTTYTLRVVYPGGATRTLSVDLVVNPAPTISFSATPNTIAPGGSATLQWNAPGATQVTLNGEQVSASGSRVVSPAITTSYTLRVTLADGTRRDFTATVTVSTQPQPTRPPTVVITPENVAFLKTFPRPANDNGRGLHFNIDLRDSTIATVIPHLLSIDCKWTMIYAQDELQARRAAKACWDAGIMPIVRIGKKVDEPFDPLQYVNVLKAIGAPPYVQIYNEPGDDREWKNWPGYANYPGIFGDRWARHAATVFDAGGYPGLQILGREEMEAAVEAVKAINRTDIWQRAFFALHNYGASHPPAYPYDPRNQQDHPGATILTDDVAVLNFLAYAHWMKELIGFVLPTIGGEGGWQYGAHEDQRYPRVEAQLHGQYHAEMFDWFRTGVLSNGEPLPDYLFSITPWIEGGWGGDDWWGGVLGDKTETIQAVQSLPPFVRRFSWDTGTVPPPAGYTFTATPSNINVGDSAILEWNVTGATSVTLDGQAVASQGTKTVTPPQTTTFLLRIVFNDNSTREASVTVTVKTIQPPPDLVWDSRLDPLGVKLTRADANTSPAWRLISALYQNEFESGGTHHVYFTVQNENGASAAGLTVVVDWIGRDPRDRPAEATTDGNGQANVPIWAILHPELQDGPYFAYVKGLPSDRVSGMGLPVNRHVNFLLTFRLT